MAETVEHGRRTADEVFAEARSHFRAKRWEELARLAEVLPEAWGEEWLEVADKAAFALGQLHRIREAEALLERAWQLAPTWHCASSLAYLSYSALMQHRLRRPRLDEPDAVRRRFEHWVGRALELDPASIADWYRLGMYHASIQSRQDVKALACFRKVLALVNARLGAEGGLAGRLLKRQAQALFGAARSAYRLGRLEEARRFVFACIRADRDRDFLRPVFKLFLAAKILFAEGRLDDAERGLRLALDAPHQGDRDFVFALLAQVALAQGRIDDGRGWIDLHIRPHHRKPYVWRLLGDCEVAAGHPERAVKLYKSALLKDRGGRHKTLCKMGAAFESLGKLAEARRAFEQAAEFRRRRYLTEDVDALRALALLYEKSGATDRARDAYRRLAELPALSEWAERELERLAG